MDSFKFYVATFGGNQIPLCTYSWKNLVLIHFSENFFFILLNLILLMTHESISITKIFQFLQKHFENVTKYSL